VDFRDGFMCVMPKNTLYGVAAALLGLSATPVFCEPTVSENTHGSWTVRCEAADAGAQSGCIMFQNVVMKTGGQPVLHFAVGYAPEDGNPTVIISLPLGISLPPGISIQIDDGKTANFPVERCEPDGCRAGMKLREATIEELVKGTRLTITFHDGERQPISVPLSLDGFGPGFQALAATDH
jgi:invasion protein IalB